MDRTWTATMTESDASLIAVAESRAPPLKETTALRTREIACELFTLSCTGIPMDHGRDQAVGKRALDNGVARGRRTWRTPEPFHAPRDCMRRRINRWLMSAAVLFWTTVALELFARQGP